MNRLQEVESLVRNESTLVLATVDGDGLSRSTPLFYIYEDRRFYWFSSALSGHSKDLKRDPRAAVTVFQQTSDWKQIRGVQMRGTVATVLDRTRRKSLTAIYCDRFRLGTLFRAAISRSRLYEFCPFWFRFTDNAQGFGYKFELRIRAAGD